MRIIDEGIKGVGKTTLINKLALIFGLQVFHCTEKTVNNTQLFESMLETDNWVSDRGPYGQFVYGDEHLQIGSFSELRKLEVKMLEKEVLVIWMTPDHKEMRGYDDNVYEEIVKTRRQDYDFNKLKEEDDRFKHIFEKESIIRPKVIRVDIFGGKKEEL